MGLMAAPPAEISISLQGCSCLFSRMKRPSNSTAMRLCRRRSGAMRVSRPCERRAKVVGLPDIEHLRAVRGVAPTVAKIDVLPQANAGARG